MDTKANLLKRNEQGESITQEFKECRRDLNRDVFETVCAFLNRHGEGDIFRIIVGTPDEGSALPGTSPEITPEVPLLKAISGEMSRQNLQSALNLKDDERFRKTYLSPALQAGLIEMTIPDKAKSSKQKYRLTTKGRTVLQKKGGM